MPLVIKYLNAIQQNARDESKPSTLEKGLLSSSAQQMRATLDRIASVATHACTVFDELKVMSTTMSTDIKRLGHRMEKVHIALDEIENHSKRVFGPKIPQLDTTANNYFTPSNGSRLRSTLQACYSPPNVSLLDSFSKCGPCLKKFSDPDYFQDTWLQSEDVRLKELESKQRHHRIRRSVEHPIKYVGHSKQMSVSSRSSSHAGNERNSNHFEYPENPFIEDPDDPFPDIDNEHHYSNEHHYYDVDNKDPFSYDDSEHHNSNNHNEHQYYNGDNEHQASEKNVEYMSSGTPQQMNSLLKQNMDSKATTFEVRFQKPSKASGTIFGENDEKFNKYSKMLKAGLPIQVVIQASERDGVTLPEYMINTDTIEQYIKPDPKNNSNAFLEALGKGQASELTEKRIDVLHPSLGVIENGKSVKLELNNASVDEFIRPNSNSLLASIKKGTKLKAIN